jgi:hypothetical protein
MAGISFAAQEEGGPEPSKLEKPAVIGAYKRIVAEMKGGETDRQDPARFAPFPEDALDIVAGYKRLIDRFEAPLGLFEYSKMQGALRMSTEPYQWNAAQKATIAEFLSEHQDTVREIRRMAERGGPIHPLDFSKGYEMTLPHLGEIRGWARLLRASAALNGMKGDYAAAVDDIIAGMKLGDALAQEPVLISQLVRIVIYTLMDSAVENSFHGTDLSPELTERLMTHLDQADRRGEFAESLAGGLYMGRTTFAALRSGDGKRLLEGMFPGRRHEDPGPPQEEDEETYVGIMQRLIAAASLPYYEALSQLRLIESDIANVSENLPYSAQLLRGLRRVCQPQARHEASIDLMQIGIRLEQYKAQEGRYPLTLDPLAEDLGGTVPPDPFTGREYIYRPAGDRFILYSVGENLRNDDGKHPFPSRRYYTEGDIVWRGRKTR